LPKRSPKVAKTPECKFLWALSKRFGKNLDDPFFDKMNPYLKRLLFELWINEQNDEMEKLRSFGIFVGSFSNPEAAKQMNQMDNPDFNLSDEEFDQSFNIVLESRSKKEQNDPNFLIDEQRKMKEQKKRRRVIARSLKKD
jgi:hypothetical protein